MAPRSGVATSTISLGCVCLKIQDTFRMEEKKGDICSGYKNKLSASLRVGLDPSAQGSRSRGVWTDENWVIRSSSCSVCPLSQRRTLRRTQASLQVCMSCVCHCAWSVRSTFGFCSVPQWQEYFCLPLSSSLLSVSFHTEPPRSEVQAPLGGVLCVSQAGRLGG